MNRTIKFRAKGIEPPHFDQWIYGDLLTRRSTNQISISQTRQFNIATETIGQYSGQKDKNGKEIYEGDILKFHIIRSRHNGFDYVDYIEEHIAVVVFQGSSFDIKNMADRHESDYPISYLCAEWDSTPQAEFDACTNRDRFPELTTKDMWRCEVIGNIYDNKEILEKYETIHDQCPF